MFLVDQSYIVHTGARPEGSAPPATASTQSWIYSIGEGDILSLRCLYQLATCKFNFGMHLYSDQVMGKEGESSVGWMMKTRMKIGFIE